jgi:hypothetical protein
MRIGKGDFQIGQGAVIGGRRVQHIWILAGQHQVARAGMNWARGEARED